MAFCLAELHLWSTKSSLQVKDTDIGTYQFYDKGEPARGYSWTPRNRRPQKLRHSLRDLEELLQTNTCIHTRWRSRHCCQVMLSSGVLVTLTLNGPELHQILIDGSLTGRLPADTVTDAVLSDGLVLLSFLEQSQVAAVYLQRKKQDSVQAGRPPDKLSASEVKVMCVDVGGSSPTGRRHVSLNRDQDVALCWWNLDQSGEGLWTDTHQNNLVLISCSHTEGLQVMDSVRTEGNLLFCCFSRLQPHQLLAVGGPPDPPGPGEPSWADVSVYECSGGRLKRRSVHRLPLPSPPISCSPHPSETWVLLGLSDSSLVLYHRRRGVSLLAPCPVPPTLLAWHPAGALVVVVGGRDELTCFDVGLAPLGVALVAEEEAPADTLRLTQQLRCAEGLSGLRWGAGPQWGAGPDGDPEGVDVLTLVFHGGPLAALRFRLGVLTGGRLGLEELLQQRLRCDQVPEALGLLESLDWSSMAEQSFRGLSSVTNHLLRLQLSAEREAQLEAALAAFYSPAAAVPLAVMQTYREPIRTYARRFFHHLLRHQRFEKAFLLAGDLQATDLFMDLHYVARDKGELVLADVAKKKANEMEARTSAGYDLRRSRSSEQQTKGNTSAAAPSHSETHSDGGADHRPAAGHFLWTLRQTAFPAGSSRSSRDGVNDNDEPDMLHVVHLGVV